NQSCCTQHTPPRSELELACRRSVDRRDPHSFPTRRSSDLPAGPMPGTWHSASQWSRSVARDRDRGDPARASRTPTPIMRPPRSRSEEHTSELQSREKLVCRLLLEKKKKTEGGQ